MAWDEMRRVVKGEIGPDGNVHLTDEAYEFLVEKVYQGMRANRHWVTSEVQLADQLARTSALTRPDCERVARAIAELELGIE